jgi:hypothetical protein
MSLMMFISSSSFFLPNYLTKQLNDNDFSDAQFDYALKSQNITAMIIAEKKAVLGSTHWLNLNKTLAKTQRKSALKLAYWYKNLINEEQKNKNNILITPTTLWFEQAIRLGSQTAAIVLAELYYQHGLLTKVQATLDKLPDVLTNKILAESALLLRLNIAIDLGDTRLVNTLLNSDVSKLASNTTIDSLLANIDKYLVIDQKAVFTKNTFDKSSSCITSLQLFATNIKHLKHIELLIKGFKAQQPLAKYICLPTPRYISLEKLDCTANRHEAIFCDEAIWEGIAEKVDSRHIGLMLKEGGANVHMGILYFDTKDNVDVFSHEISHLLGFVDEYPLIKAHDKCRSVQAKPFSHNIAVLENFYQGTRKSVRSGVLKNIPWAVSIKTSTPILQEAVIGENNEMYWRLGTPMEFQDKVGLHIAESCQKATEDINADSTRVGSGLSAFKPLSRHTQLRYFSSDFPVEYLTLLQMKPKAYLMPSFHYNIAFALFQQGQTIDAKYWLEQAAKWEEDPLKKVIILKGEFNN